MTRNGFSENTNQEAKHGNATVQQLGFSQALTLDLSRSLQSYLLPEDGRGHRTSINISKY